MTASALSSGSGALRAVETGEHLRRQRAGLEAVAVVRVAHGPQPRLEAFEREDVALRHPVMHKEARATKLGDLSLDLDVLAVVGGHLEDGARFQERHAGAVVLLQQDRKSTRLNS